MEAKASVPLDGTEARDCSLPKLSDKNPDSFEVRFLCRSLLAASVAIDTSKVSLFASRSIMNAVALTT